MGVLTAQGFSKVFAFMDHANDFEIEYLRLRTDVGSELALTAGHMVYAHIEKQPVLAGSLVEGDILWLVEKVGSAILATTPVHVVQIQWSRESGMHAPLTAEGSVVVNGVLASSYAGVETLRWGSLPILSGH